MDKPGLPLKSFVLKNLNHNHVSKKRINIGYTRRTTVARKELARLDIEPFDPNNRRTCIRRPGPGSDFKPRSFSLILVFFVEFLQVS